MSWGDPPASLERPEFRVFNPLTMYGVVLSEFVDRLNRGNLVPVVGSMSKPSPRIAEFWILGTALVLVGQIPS